MWLIFNRGPLLETREYIDFSIECLKYLLKNLYWGEKYIQAFYTSLYCATKNVEKASLGFTLMCRKKYWESLIELYFTVSQKLLRKSHWALLCHKNVEKVSSSFTLLCHKNYWESLIELYCATKIIEKVSLSFTLLCHKNYWESSLSFTVPQKLLRKSHWALLYCATKNVEKSSLSFLPFLKQCKVAWKIILRRLFRGITMVDDFLAKYFLLKDVFSQTFKIGLFAKNWWRLKTFELFLHKIPS